MEQIAKNLRFFRKQHNLTLNQLSKASGVKVGTISAIEQNRIKSPSLTNLNKLTKALGLPINHLLEEISKTPTFHKGDLSGFVELNFKSEGLKLISYTPLQHELFIGKAVLKPKKTFDLKKFPRLSTLFLEIIFGKLNVSWDSQTHTLTEGENLSLRSLQNKKIWNPFQIKETSFLIVSSPSLISANLAIQKQQS